MHAGNQSNAAHVEKAAPVCLLSTGPLPPPSPQTTHPPTRTPARAQEHSRQLERSRAQEAAQQQPLRRADAGASACGRSLSTDRTRVSSPCAKQQQRYATAACGMTCACPMLAALQVTRGNGATAQQVGGMRAGVST